MDGGTFSPQFLSQTHGDAPAVEASIRCVLEEMPKPRSGLSRGRADRLDISACFLAFGNRANFTRTLGTIIGTVIVDYGISYNNGFMHTDSQRIPLGSVCLPVLSD